MPTEEKGAMFELLLVNKLLLTNWRLDEAELVPGEVGVIVGVFVDDDGTIAPEKDTLAMEGPDIIAVLFADTEVAVLEGTAVAVEDEANVLGEGTVLVVDEVDVAVALFGRDTEVAVLEDTTLVVEDETNVPDEGAVLIVNEFDVAAALLDEEAEGVGLKKAVLEGDEFVAATEPELMDDVVAEKLLKYVVELLDRTLLNPEELNAVVVIRVLLE